MADSIPWFKAMQSVDRGFRPGMEVKVASSGGRGHGKSVLIDIDIESSDFNPWRETFRTHYAEYRDFATGETYWKKFKRIPKMADLYTADNVIRHSEDGSYEYIKNRVTGELVKVGDAEMAFIILACAG